MNAYKTVHPTQTEPPADALGVMGRLEVRLARNGDEVDACQALRYRIFSSEFGARFDPQAAARKRDRDPFDAYCDHLVVIDHGIDAPVREQIVGTYRLCTHTAGHHGAARTYSQAEFDVAALMARHPDKTFLELGRSCVLPAWRGKRTIELLWQGIWAVCRAKGVEAMFGCASFAGTDPQRHALALSFLHHFARAQAPWHVSALADSRAGFEPVNRNGIDMRAALAAMPALIKGYLRLGATFGDGVVVDPMFATTDVMVVLPVEKIAARYINHYGTDATRFAA